MRKPWTTEERDWLKDNYKKIPLFSICAVLGRSKNSVIAEAHRLGLSEPKTHVRFVPRVVPKYNQKPKQLPIEEPHQPYLAEYLPTTPGHGKWQLRCKGIATIGGRRA